jgi:hypothetical protein
MRKRPSCVTVYLTAEELTRMREQATGRRITVSRYARDLIMDADQAKDQHIIKLQRIMAGCRVTCGRSYRWSIASPN